MRKCLIIYENIFIGPCRHTFSSQCIRIQQISMDLVQNVWNATQVIGFILEKLMCVPTT